MSNTHESCTHNWDHRARGTQSQAVPKTPDQTPEAEEINAKQKKAAPPCKDKLEEVDARISKAAPVCKKVSRRGIYAKDSEGSRRNQLNRERLDELWLNRRCTSKGGVVGWYLDPQAHEPFWIKRKYRAHKVVRKILSDEQVKLYQSIRKARLCKNVVLTQGELRACARVFEKRAQVEIHEHRSKARELAKILRTLEDHVH